MTDHDARRHAFVPGGPDNTCTAKIPLRADDDGPDADMAVCGYPAAVPHMHYGCDACSWATEGCSQCRPMSAIDRMAADDEAEAALARPEAVMAVAPAPVMPGAEVIVLLRDRGDAVTVHAVYADQTALQRGLDSIVRQNPQYPLQQLGPDVWRIGPEAEDSFFGHQPVYLTAARKPVRR